MTKKECKVRSTIKSCFQKVIGLRPLFKFLILLYALLIVVLCIVIYDQTTYNLKADRYYNRDFRNHFIEKGTILDINEQRSNKDNTPIYITSSSGTELYFEPLTANFKLKKGSQEYNTIPYESYGYTISDMLDTRKISVNHHGILSPINIYVKNELHPTGGAFDMFGYNLSVVANEFDVYKLKNGVRIEYLMKNAPYHTSQLPYKINHAMYEKLLLEYCENEVEKGIIRSKYVSEQLGSSNLYFLQATVSGSEEAKMLYKIWYGNYGLTQKELERLNESKVIYDISFTIPVEYRIEDSGVFSATILTDRIENNSIISRGKKWLIEKMELHPAFIRLEDGVKARAFIPDGSGVLIENDHSIFPRSINFTITKNLYDNDRSVNPNINLSQYNTAIPAFGYYTNELVNNKGILGIVKNGARQTSLISRKQFGAIEQRVIHHLEVIGKYSLHGSMSLDFPSPKYDKDRFQLAYVLLENDTKPLTYFDLVKAFQQEMLEPYFNKVNKKQEIVIEILGSFEEKKHVIGIPYYRTTPLTTFNEASVIADTFKGITDTFIYQGWTKGNETSRIANTYLSFAGTLGGKKAFNKFEETINNNGQEIYLAYNLIRSDFAKAGRFKNKNHGINYIGEYKQPLYEIHPVSGKQNKKEPYYYLSQRFLNDSTNDFLRKNKYENVVINDLGNIAVFDYYAKNITPEIAQLIECEALEKVANSRNLILRNPYYYALEDNNYLLDLQMGSEGIIHYTYEIPFTFLAYKDYFNYTLPSSNVENNKTEQYDFLYSLMTLANMKYTLSYRNTELKNARTKYTKYYATQYDGFITDIYNFDKQIKSFYDEVGKEIISHDLIKKDIFAIEYTNKKVLFNLSGNDIIHEGLLVKAYSYIIL